MISNPRYITQNEDGSYTVRTTYKGFTSQIFVRKEDAEKYLAAFLEENTKDKIEKMRAEANRERQEIIDAQQFVDVDYYPYNLYTDAGVYDETFDEEVCERALDRLFENVTERTRTITLMFYKDHMTLKVIGKKYKLSRERIRQIVAKAVKQFKHYVLTTRSEMAREYKQSLISALRDTGIIPTELQEDVDEVENPNVITIDDLDFSVRTYNCLRRYFGSKMDQLNRKITIDDLAELPYDEYMKIRNFGKKSFKEVKMKLAELGYEIRN